MKNEMLNLLKWLKENKADEEQGFLKIPKKFIFIIEEIVGDNRTIYLGFDLIQKNYLYQRILINKQYAFSLPEKYWHEQFYLIRETEKTYHKVMNEITESGFLTKSENNEIQQYKKQLEYLKELESHLKEKMANSDLSENKLCYLLG